MIQTSVGIRFSNNNTKIQFYIPNRDLAETTESRLLCTTDLFQNKTIAYFNYNFFLLYFKQLFSFWKKFKLFFGLENIKKTHQKVAYLWQLGGLLYTANVFPIKSAGNPCVAKCWSQTSSWRFNLNLIMTKILYFHSYSKSFFCKIWWFKFASIKSAIPKTKSLWKKYLILKTKMHIHMILGNNRFFKSEPKNLFQHCTMAGVAKYCPYVICLLSETYKSFDVQMRVMLRFQVKKTKPITYNESRKMKRDARLKAFFFPCFQSGISLHSGVFVVRYSFNRCKIVSLNSRD